ncbi:MBL fold metallo-hydrolase [Aestuariibacter salexigens]|uniref:MBL fold metallo-hydrolase n=1 Tax=Aestuariibacter salexigens TaxID=226010 RepID=UPI00040157BC|nr:MBL fold metallo-hydrolase [Aestuariibacter salexigens]
MKTLTVTLFLLLTVNTTRSIAHQQGQHSDVHYLGNEGVIASHGEIKVMFDPFFHNTFGIYQAVPERLRQAVFAQTPPYNDIDAIVISHAHEDHFSADDVLAYLAQHHDVSLIAPQQAIEQLVTDPRFQVMKDRIYPISLAFGDTPISLSVGELAIEAVRIPHAGWPSRADVENLVFRIGLTQELTVMHLGDADPDVDHYLPVKEHWQKKRTDIAFPPYWFYYNLEGNAILDEYMNIENHVGVHVPTEPPKWLLNSGKAFFSEPGTSIEIE